MKLEDIAHMIGEGDLTMSQATIMYNLTKADKETIRTILKEATKASEENDDMRQRLLDDMRQRPHEYYAERMTSLFNGDKDSSDSENQLYGDFLRAGRKLSYEEVAEACGLPPSITRNVICDLEFPLPEHSITEYGDTPLPKYHTDLFILGAAGSGKSMLVCSLLKTLADRYEAVLEQSGERKEWGEEYFNWVIRHTRKFHKGVSTSLPDGLVTCPVKIGNTRKRINIIDVGRRALAELSRLHNEQHGTHTAEVYKLLANDNEKMIFFTLDYRQVAQRNHTVMLRQAINMENTLMALLNDGRGKRNDKGCTLSKVSAMGIIVTKTDLSTHTSQESLRDDVDDFIAEYLLNFMNRLSVVCKRFGINKKNENVPYILMSNLGRFSVGNTLVYNSETTEKIAEIIVDICPTQWVWNMSK